MKLTTSQIQEYHEKGYLIVDTLFSQEEVLQLRASIGKIDDKPMPNIIREENGDIRSVFAPQDFRPEFDWLYKQDRLITPTQQLLDDSSIYLYQYKLNNKKAFGGGIWEWHQDFPFWCLDDGVDKPHMLSVMILLQDTGHAQGPLMFIPKSQKTGIADFQYKAHFIGKEVDLVNSLNADLKYTIKNERIREMVDQDGIIPGIGQAGTCIFFHPNIYHGSNANISPYDRNTAIITYNSTSNTPPDRKEKNRPEYICSRKFESIKVNTQAINNTPQEPIKAV